MSSRADDFNRADNGSALGTPSDAGSSWVAANGTWGIGTNRARNFSEGSSEIAYLEASAADVEVQVTLPTFVTDGGSDARVIARYADANNYLLFRVKNGGWDLYKNVAGSFTQLFDVGGTPADGDVLKLVCSGTTISCYVNGAQKGANQTVSDGSANTKHGISAHNNGVKFDDFSITELGGGTKAPPVFNRPTRFFKRRQSQ
jgi:hypothetical protein